MIAALLTTVMALFGPSVAAKIPSAGPLVPFVAVAWISPLFVMLTGLLMP